MGDVNSRQGDLADQASGNNEVHIQLKLKQTDAKILQAIEEALRRIEKGTYGICRDCGEPIAAAAAQRHPLDPRLHHLQGKTERVKPPISLQLLTRLLPRQVGAPRSATSPAARLVGNYDFNNTYQYVDQPRGRAPAVAARRDRGSRRHAADAPEPQVTAAGQGRRADRSIREDRDQAQAFVDKWRRASRQITNARHRTMLRLMLGETLEQKRFFEQALAGRTDLLGRRADGAGTKGSVLPTRWVE